MIQRKRIRISTGSSINNAGQVTGYSFTSDGAQHAFLYSDGQMTDLGTLGGSYSTAYGINDAGQVVGSSTTPTGAGHTFLYSNGQMSDLGTLGGFAINDAGQITGSFP